MSSRSTIFWSIVFLTLSATAMLMDLPDASLFALGFCILVLLFNCTEVPDGR